MKKIRHLFYPRQGENGKKCFKEAGEKARREAEEGCSPAEHLAVFLGGESSLSPSCQERVDQTH